MDDIDSSNYDESSSHNEKKEPTFSFGVTVAFTLNYIIGTGFLTLPWAFYQSGNILGLFVLGTITIFAIASALMLLEAMARAEAYANMSNNFGSIIGDRNYHSLPNIGIKNDSQDFTALRSTKSNHSEPFHDHSFDLHVVGDTKYEVTELCKIFIGKQSVRLYTALLSLYLYGSLWAYSTVFANSMAMRVPLSNQPGTAQASYGAYLLIFSIIVVPSSMIELSEQVYVQVFLSACRVLMLILMISTVIHSMYQATPEFQINAVIIEKSEYGDEGASNLTANVNNIFAMHINKIYLLLPIAAYASIFHHSIPAISQPVKNKLHLGWIYTITLLICFVAYSIMSITISSYFGDNTIVSTNLNWQYYIGTVDKFGNVPFYAKLISFFIVLLPAFDVASAYPLNAITLGNNLMSSYYGSKIHILSSTQKTNSKLIFRCIAAIPPIFASSLVSDLGMITHFAGVSGFAIAFIIPPLLAIFSYKMLIHYGISTKTQYSCVLTSLWVCALSIIIGISLIIFVVVSLIVMGSPSST